jgi:predicted DNA-binding transcriptional regulator AlpA
MTATTVPSLLNTEEVQRALRCSRMTIYNLVKRGRLSQPINTGGRWNLWPAEEIAAIARGEK